MELSRRKWTAWGKSVEDWWRNWRTSAPYPSVGSLFLYYRTLRFDSTKWRWKSEQCRRTANQQDDARRGTIHKRKKKPLSFELRRGSNALPLSPSRRKLYRCVPCWKSAVVLRIWRYNRKSQKRWISQTHPMSEELLRRAIGTNGDDATVAQEEQTSTGRNVMQVTRHPAWSR